MCFFLIRGSRIFVLHLFTGRPYLLEHLHFAGFLNKVILMLIDYVLKYSGEMFNYVRCLYFGLEFDFHKDTAYEEL